MSAATLAASTGQTGGAAPAPPKPGHLTLVTGAQQSLPPIALHGQGHHQATLPGEFWPALSLTQFQQPGRPIIGWWEIEQHEAEELLIGWKHRLHENGEPYKRPFGSMYFRMDVMGRPTAVVVTASSCNEWVSKKHGLGRYDCVDLARICRSPDHRDTYCLRAVLRLSREYLAPLFPLRYPKKWSVLKAVCANQLPKADGSRLEVRNSMYAFDGFELVRVTKGMGGGGKRGRPSKAADIGDGIRGLWVYRYPEPHGA